VSPTDRVETWVKVKVKFKVMVGVVNDNGVFIFVYK